MRNLIPKSSPLALAVLLSVAGPANSQHAGTPDKAPAASGFDVRELSIATDPCRDFYGFVNSKWVESHPIPADRTIWDNEAALDERSRAIQRDIVENADRHADTAKPGSVEQKLGWYYRSGMDEAAIERAGYDPVKPILADIAALKSNAQIPDFLNRRFAQGDRRVFNFGSGTDSKDATKVIGYASQGNLYLPSAYYLEAKHGAERAAYHAYIVRTFSLTGSSARQAEEQAGLVMTFETALASASLKPVELRDPANRYHLISVDEAEKLTPHFSWKLFFAAQGVHIDKGFSLAQPVFFTEFDKLLAQAPLAQWQAYLRFHTVVDNDNALSKAFASSYFEFEKALRGQSEQEVRWKRILQDINRRMDSALGELYAAREFTPAAKQQATMLVNELLEAFRLRIEKVDWMTPETKQKALAKLSLIVPVVGYPDHWRDWSGLDIRPEGYYANLQRVAAFNYHYSISKIGKPIDPVETVLPPQEANAAYFPSTNIISLPAAYLQPPEFDPQGDMAMNYGAIGATIGHEISHAFDDEGSKFDGHGNQIEWWSKQDRAEFEQRVAKLVEQFDHYHPIATKPDLHVNGRLTLGENIADLGGLNVAYDAMHLAMAKQAAGSTGSIGGYTADQRFFISFTRSWRVHTTDQDTEFMLAANPHAPYAIRAIAAPSNMPAFAAAFQCKPGSPMVREKDKQVKIW